MPPTLDLTVVDARGTPVAGALVTVEHGTAAVPERAIVTGADGRCRVALPNGRFRLAAFHEGREGRVEVTGKGVVTLTLLPPP